VYDSNMHGERIKIHKMYVLIFSRTLVENFLILRIIERNMINVYWSSCRAAGLPVILARF